MPTKLEKFNEIGERPPPTCCGEPMRFSILHDTTPEKWVEMEDPERAESAILIAFVCEKCEKEIDQGFHEWREKPEPPKPVSPPSHDEKLLAALERIAVALERSNDLAAPKPAKKPRRRQWMK